MASTFGARAVPMADIRIISSIGFSVGRISCALFQDVAINVYLIEEKRIYLIEIISYLYN